MNVGCTLRWWQAVSIVVMAGTGSPCQAAEDSSSERPVVKIEPRGDESLAIDGELDESRWQQLIASPEAALTDWVRVGDADRPSYDDRSAYLLYDATHLYVGVMVTSGTDDSLLDDADDLLKPDNVQVDFPSVSLGIDWEGRQLEILLPYLVPIRAAVKETETGWTGEIAIPWEHVGGMPDPGERRQFNIAGRDLSGSITWTPLDDLRDEKCFSTFELAPDRCSLETSE